MEVISITLEPVSKDELPKVEELSKGRKRKRQEAILDGVLERGVVVEVWNEVLEKWFTALILGKAEDGLEVLILGKNVAAGGIQRDWVRALSEGDNSVFVERNARAARAALAVGDEKSTELRVLTTCGAVPFRYWCRRQYLWGLEDGEFAFMDVAAYWEMTPKSIAFRIASVFKEAGVGRVLDGFCGVGGNSVQFCRRGLETVAVDNDSQRVEFTKLNVEMFCDCGGDCEVVCADLLEFGERQTIEKGGKGGFDAVFLAPPWGGPSDRERKFQPRTDIPIDSWPQLLKSAASLTLNCAIYLPRDTDLDTLREDIEHAFPPHTPVLAETHKFRTRSKPKPIAMTVYIGSKLVEAAKK